ncbi:hypothetical protein PDIDSM_6880 [Penicillium digitatum]|nr:hypothetical protein PDIDSM_6880 [Penicillium digitatum]
MQEKPTTVAAYAAGASLAAVALFYVFGPNYTIDGDESNDSNRKKSIVGLSNLANDCFINSVLQALAGLGNLRVYLIHELHRRQLDGPEIYHTLPSDDELSRARSDKLRELQQGITTRALKEMLDRLNERPIYKKTISARDFIQALEYAFRTRISRHQQDAQEFLQIVLERLCDEYHAGARARQRALGAIDAAAHSTAGEEGSAQESSSEVEVRIDDGSAHGQSTIIDTKLKKIDYESGFPFEGTMESQIECQFCHYQYKPNQTAFVNLTLQVPQKSSTTLNSCFDGLLKTEYIFRFDAACAIYTKTTELARARTQGDRDRLGQEISRLREALEIDPEAELEGIVFPPPETAPKRRIARHMRITAFPKVIPIHLSRSIFDQSSSSKNAAKVSFPERLPLGSILCQKWYKLLAIVCHKGSHHSGHYESFRRNHIYPPFSTPEVFSSYAQSRTASRNPSAAPSPRIVPRSSPDADGDGSTSRVDSSTSLSGASLTQLTPPHLRPTTSGSRHSFQSTTSRSSKQNLSPASNSNSPTTDQGCWSPSAPRPSHRIPRPSQDTPTGVSSRLRRRRKPNDRWWRISDDKIKECKTSDVLGMQREVYLLFYELERPDASPP